MSKLLKSLKILREKQQKELTALVLKHSAERKTLIEKESKIEAERKKNVKRKKM